MAPINMDFSSMLSDEPVLKAEQDDYEEPEDTADRYRTWRYY